MWDDIATFLFDDKENVFVLFRHGPAIVTCTWDGTVYLIDGHAEELESICFQLNERISAFTCGLSGGNTIFPSLHFFKSSGK